VGLTAVGYQAASSSSTASSITAIGYKALYNNTGDENTAIGDSALYSNTTATYNVAIGYRALAANTTMIGNVAIGTGALTTQSYNNPNGLGTLNTAIGIDALYYNQPTSANNGIYNTAIGGGALAHNTTGYQNTACGVEALSNLFAGSVTGMSNTATGFFASTLITSASSNTADGANALFINNGDYNTAIGDSALASNTTGKYNTALGYQADIAGTGSLTNATAIGYNAKVATSNSVMLGNSNITYATIGAGAFAVPVQESPATSGTVTSIGAQILNLTGSASALTIVPPTTPTPVEGQLWEVTTNQASISITWSGSFVAPPSTVTNTAPARFFYVASLASWESQ